MLRRYIFLFVCCTLIGSAAHARDAVVGMSERVFKVINKAQTEMEAEQYSQALATLAGVNTNRVTPYEHAQLKRLEGLVLYQSDQLDEAIVAFDEALALPRLPQSLTANLLATVGRMALTIERHAYAQEKLNALLLIEDQDTAENRVLLASAYIGQEKWPDALEQLQQAIAERAVAGETPRESWLSMLASVHFAMESFPEMRHAMEELVTYYPREQYLMNLAALHGQLGEQQKQLAYVEALLDDQRLSQALHLKMLANLFLAEGLPYKAAQLLARSVEQGAIENTIENLELLSQAWYSAGELENAWPPLEEAARLADDGTLYLRLAGLHLDAYRWAAADAAAAQAIDKGGLEREGRAWLIRGMANVRLDELEEAAKHFQRAVTDPASKDYADQWLAYVNNEQRAQSAGAR